MGGLDRRLRRLEQQAREVDVRIEIQWVDSESGKVVEVTPCTPPAEDGLVDYRRQLHRNPSLGGKKA